MSDMKIFVVNLASYNDGDTKGEWFDLPVEMEEIYEEIFDEHELDENGQPHGDWAIHNSELPFEINEYESIEVLNGMSDEAQTSPHLEEILDDDYDINTVIGFADDMGQENVGDDIISAEEMNDVVQAKLDDNENGWIGAKQFLNGIKDINADHFRIDGYANAENVPEDYAETVLSDVFDELKSNVEQTRQNARNMRNQRNQENEMGD